MLRDAKVTAFVAVQDTAKARKFYEGVLGLEVESHDSFALVVRAGDTTIRITQVQRVVHAPYTVLGWVVPDIVQTVTALKERGVQFIRYPGMVQDERGIWGAPGGALVAWFQDPDENVISITEHV